MNTNDEAISEVSIPPFPDFNVWFNSIVEETRPQIIIGIARGAIRLLQLQQVNRDLGNIEILSHLSLPFLKNSEIRSKRVLLFDDSVIFGSTMSKVRGYLINRKAIVFAASYVIDKYNFYGYSELESDMNAFPSIFSSIPIRKRHVLNRDQIRRHHDHLIRTILQTPNHYNLDFPTFELKTQVFSNLDIPYMVSLLQRGDLFRVIHDVSPSVSADSGIYRFSGLFKNDLWQFFPENGLNFRNYSKIRITFVPSLGRIYITPIPQLTMEDNTFFDNVIFKDEKIMELWRTLQPPHSKNDPNYGQSIFRLLTSYIAFIVGVYVSRKCMEYISREYPVEGIELIEDDIKCVIGHKNSRILKEIYLGNRNYFENPNSQFRAKKRTFEVKEPIDHSLMNSIPQIWGKYPFLLPVDSETIYEILGKIFLALNIATDSQECRKKNPDASRLEKGFSYDGLRELLKDHCQITLSPDEISLGIDICIDNGQAVPKVIRQDSTWLRAFYSGEGVHSQGPLQLKSALNTAYSQFLEIKKSKELSPFDFHKICATLKRLFPWLPISTKFYTFGMFSRVGQSEYELIPWLTDPNSGPFKIDKIENKRVLLINDKYSPCVEPTWQFRDCRDFYDAFDYIARVFNRIQDTHKLLLSTCPTHRDTYNAVAFEAHSWVSRPRNNFNTAISGLSIINNNMEINNNAITALYWCIRYISEARKKYIIFHHDFKKLSAKLGNEFKRHGSAAYRFWQYYIVSKKILDPNKEEEIEGLFTMLMPLIKQMTRLTAFLTKLILGNGILTFERLNQEFIDRGVSLNYGEFQWLEEYDILTTAGNYNNEIIRKQIPGISIVKTHLPSNPPLDSDTINCSEIKNILSTIEQCYNEIANSLKEYCKEYPVSEGDYQYSPLTAVRPLQDGSTERILNSVFILTLDIINSTDRGMTHLFKDCILDTFARFKQHGLYFEKTGNDAYVIVSENVALLWDIANSIRIAGENYISSPDYPDGTRKALYFGNIRLIESRDGSTLIRDALLPHCLPRAFGILEALKEYCKSNSIPENPLIAIDGMTAEQCKEVLDLDLDQNDLISLSSKHYLGKCYIFRLGPNNSIKI